VSVNDFKNWKELDMSEQEMLDEVKNGGGITLTKDSYLQLRKMGFSAEFLGKVRELTGKPKLPELPLHVRECARRVSGSEAEKIWAIILGVNEYKENKFLPNLHFAVADAESFAKQLLAAGVPEGQICLLTGESVTLQKIERVVKELGRVQASTLYFFYSGHGLYTEPGKFYLSCHDTTKKDLANSAYGMDKLQKARASLQSERVVVLLDACHSGSAKAPDLGDNDEAKVTMGQLNQEAQAKLKEMAESQKPLAIITSCGQNEVSREGKGHGLFTQSLLAGLSGKADRNNDGFVSAKELALYLNAEITAATETTQRPDYTFGHTWGEEKKGIPVAKEQQEEAGKQAEIKRQQEEAERLAEQKRRQKEVEQTQNVEKYQYHDPIFRYTISYPKEYYFTNDPKFTRKAVNLARSSNPDLASLMGEHIGLQFFIFRFQLGTPGIAFNPNINLVTEKIPDGMKLTTKQYFDLSLQNLPRLLRKVKIIEAGKAFQLNGLEFYRVSYTHEQAMQGQTLKARVLQYFYLQNETSIAYVITFSDLTANYDQHVADMEEVMQSFQFDR
jgi:uncharacterized caspase-like protein